jgi:hypothetical protein
MSTVEQTGRMVRGGEQFQHRNPASFPSYVREDELGRQLWPSAEYRRPDQLASAQVIHNLWTLGEDRVMEPIEQRLWQSAGQREMQPTLRQLWQYSGD